MWEVIRGIVLTITENAATATCGGDDCRGGALVAGTSQLHSTSTRSRIDTVECTQSEQHKELSNTKSVTPTRDKSGVNKPSGTGEDKGFIMKNLVRMTLWC